VIRAGLFVALDETGADGIIPVSSLPNDFYDHDERRHALVGRRWGQVYRLGDRVQVRLVSAQPLTGGITFELIEGGGQESGKDRAQAPAGKTTGRSHFAKKPRPVQGPPAGVKRGVRAHRNRKRNRSKS
jgi:ribonuclease R